MISTNALQGPARRGMLARFAALIVVASALLAVPAQAVERVLKVDAPAVASANASVRVTVRASTDAGGKEQVGFLHVEYSVDGGKTWTGLCFEQNQGAAVARVLSVKTGASGTKTLVHARAAYRGGAAGDVDFKGGAIKWQDSWTNWAEPPSRIVTIEVR
jgi:hypothetical protein